MKIATIPFKLILESKINAGIDFPLQEFWFQATLEHICLSESQSNSDEEMIIEICNIHEVR